MGAKRLKMLVFARVGFSLLVGLLLLAGLRPGGVASTGEQVYSQFAYQGPAPTEVPQIEMAPMRPATPRSHSPRTGHLPPQMDLSHLTGRMPRDAAPQQLPGEFDWRDYGVVSSVKNQGNCGSCYAFGTLGSFESKLLIGGAGMHDLSENHAKECNWREQNDFEFPAGTPWGSCDGGNALMLANLFSKAGTVLESCDPYSASDVACSTSCAYQKTVLDWRLINGENIPDTEVLKQYLYDHGPLITAMHAGVPEFEDYDGSYTLNYMGTGTIDDHCILLVGWSDNLPPEPGSSTPADGWILKNSYGTGWGDNGYFYVTYGAANVGLYSSFMHEWQDYDPNGDIFYYDDDGLWTGMGCGTTTMWALAKFVPASNTNVTRVEFWTTDATTDVDVYLHDSFDGSTLGNKLAEKLNNAFAEAGYHSVALDTPLPVTTGNDIVAVVKFTNASYTYPAPVDAHGPIETGRTYLSCSGSSWYDAGVSYDRDVAIRLRTSTGIVQDHYAYLPLVQKRESGGWTTIHAEDFEGSFPGPWDVWDGDDAAYGEYYWWKRGCIPHAGSFSGWAAGGGSSGSYLGCGASYPNNADSWMLYGPFSLADASAADLTFKLWLNSELDYDTFGWGASVDGTDFYGYIYSGNSSGWSDQALDLANVYTLGDLTGEPNVWIAFAFRSDFSITYPEGAHVDDILLRKYVGTMAPTRGETMPADPEGVRRVPARFSLEP